MNRILKYAVAGSLVLGLASCLKDKGFDDGTTGHDLTGVPKIIEIGFANESAKSKTFGLDFEDRAVERTIFYVRLAAGTVATEDITVTIDTTGSAAALIAQNPNYKPLPTSFFTTNPTGFTLVIPKGQSQAGFVLKTNAIQFDPSSTYGMIYRIASVTPAGYTISGNYGTYTVLFGAKNKYDGAYRLKVRMIASDRPTVNTATSWEWGGLVHLETVSANTNDLFDDWGFGDYIQPIQTNTGTFSGFGSTAPRFTFDNATNKLVTVVNKVVNPANGRAFQIDPTKDSYYDPASKNVYAHFIMTQPGFQPLSIADTFLYVGPR